MRSASANWLIDGNGILSFISGAVLGDDDESGELDGQDDDSESGDDETDDVGEDEDNDDEDDEDVDEGDNSGKSQDDSEDNKGKIQVIQGKIKKSVIVESDENHFKLKIIGEDGSEEELEVESGADSGELEIEEDFDKTKVKIKAMNNAALVIRNRVAAKADFPLMVNLETNELIVTTPNGSKVVTILPDAAVMNMLAANVLDQLGGKGGLIWEEYQASLEEDEDEDEEESTPSASLEPGEEEGTESGEAEESPSPSPSSEGEVLPAEEFIELVVDEEGDLVYEIEGFKEERFLGVFKVNLRRKVYVSAETGELVRINQELGTRILDVFSF